MSPINVPGKEEPGHEATSVRRRNMSFHTLSSVSRLLATLDFDEILESIVSAAIELIGGARGFLYLVDDAGTLSMRVGRSSNGTTIPPSSAPEISTSLVRRALTERRCVYVQNVADMPGLAAESSIVRLGIGSALCMPMTVTDLRPGGASDNERRRNWRPSRDVLGVIYIDRPDPGKPLSQEDYALYQAMGNLAAAALVNAAVYQDAIVDGLTGLAHRRHFERSLEWEFGRAGREKLPLSLLMLDLDFFKHVNDSLGHTAGDEVLRRAARVVRGRTRPSDIVARYGGEEFAVILPDCSIADAVRVGESLRAAVKDFFIAEGPVKITMSVGAASFDAARDKTQVDLVVRADAALYASKRGGRDRVTAWSPEQAAVEGKADDLRGIFSGEPSRDYRTMRMLVQILIDSGDSTGGAEGRLGRILQRVRESVSARRACLYRTQLGRTLRWTHAAPEGQSGPDATDDAVAQGVLRGESSPATRWAGRLERDGETVGVLVVSGPTEDKPPGPAERALLEAIGPQVALLIKEGLSNRRP